MSGRKDKNNSGYTALLGVSTGVSANIIQGATPENKIQTNLYRDFKNAEIPYVKYTFAQRVVRGLLSVVTPWSWFRSHLIKEDEIGLVWNNGRAEILGPGRHTLLSPASSFVGRKKLNESVIEHGAIKIIRVGKGQVCYMEDTADGKPFLLGEGCHVIQSLSVRYKKMILMNDPAPADPSDNIQIIRVETGNVGVKSCGGRLELMQPGIHSLVAPDCFVELIPTQFQTIELPKDNCYESSDYVPLTIHANAFFTITKPEVALNKFQPLVDSQTKNSKGSRLAAILKFMLETAISTLSGIVRNSPLSQIGQSSTPGFGDTKAELVLEEKASHPSTPSAPTAPNTTFANRIHDEFMDVLNLHTLKECGIEVENLRIESLSIANKALADSVASQATTWAKTRADLARAEAAKRIAIADGAAKTVEAENDKKITVTRAEGRSQALEAEVKGECAVITQKATAEAEAIRIKAQAEKERLELLGKALEGYSEFAKQNMLAEHSVKAMQSNTKVVLMPMQGDASILNAFGLLGAANVMTRELNSGSSSDNNLLVSPAPVV